MSPYSSRPIGGFGLRPGRRAKGEGFVIALGRRKTSLLTLPSVCCLSQPPAAGGNGARGSKGAHKVGFSTGHHYLPSPLPLPKLGEEEDAERNEAGKGEGFSNTF
jgi:hypothetical protein